MRVRLPQPPDKFKDIRRDKKNDKDFEKEIHEYLTQLVQSIERTLERIPERPVTRDRIKVTNNTKTYTFDVTGATLADTKLVLGTFLEQLQEAGLIS